MARRRSYYVRDRNGRFSNIAGGRNVALKPRKMSTKKKVAIAAAGAAAVTVVGVGAYELHRAGARKGYATGLRHAKQNAKPKRDAKGRMTGQKRTPRTDPFSRSRKREARIRARQTVIRAKNAHRTASKKSAGYRYAAKHVAGFVDNRVSKVSGVKVKK